MEFRLIANSEHVGLKSVLAVRQPYLLPPNVIVAPVDGTVRASCYMPRHLPVSSKDVLDIMSTCQVKSPCDSQSQGVKPVLCG